MNIRTTVCENRLMLVLVVGPSGAGKDTIMRSAQAKLANCGAIRFVKRFVTRRASDFEENVPVDPATFARMKESGAFAFTWAAHGLRYGIPADIGPDIAEGKCIVVNGSRGIIAEAAIAFPTGVILVTAPLEILTARLMARGREDEEDIRRRLRRSVPVPSSVTSGTVVNDSSIELGTERFIAELTRLMALGPRA